MLQLRKQDKNTNSKLQTERDLFWSSSAKNVKTTIWDFSIFVFRVLETCFGADNYETKAENEEKVEGEYNYIQQKRQEYIKEKKENEGLTFYFFLGSPQKFCLPKKNRRRIGSYFFLLIF